MAKLKAFNEAIGVPASSPDKFNPPDETLKAMFPDGMTKAQILQYAPDDLEDAILSRGDKDKQ